MALSAGALTPFASATGGVNAPAEAERPKATSIFREYMVGSSRLQTPRYHAGTTQYLYCSDGLASLKCNNKFHQE